MLYVITTLSGYSRLGCILSSDPTQQKVREYARTATQRDKLTLICHAGRAYVSCKFFPAEINASLYCAVATD